MGCNTVDILVAECTSHGSDVDTDNVLVFQLALLHKQCIIVVAESGTQFEGCCSRCSAHSFVDCKRKRDDYCQHSGVEICCDFLHIRLYTCV